jgi:hypothetical protein
MEVPRLAVLSGRTHQRSGPRAPELPLLRRFRRSRWQRMDRPGDHTSGAWPHRSGDDDLCISKRSGKRHAAGRSRPRRAREAQRAARRELAELVRSIHGGGADRDKLTEVNDYLLVANMESHAGESTRRECSSQAPPASYVMAREADIWQANKKRSL